jgi:hypothetical protein
MWTVDNHGEDLKENKDPYWSTTQSELWTKQYYHSDKSEHAWSRYLATSRDKEADEGDKSEMEEEDWYDNDDKDDKVHW